MNKSIARQIAEFALQLKYEDVPDNVVGEVKRYLYDSVGCAYGGYHTRDVNILRDIYTGMGGKEEATLLGFGDKMPAVNATLVNSLMVRALDFNGWVAPSNLFGGVSFRAEFPFQTALKQPPDGV